MDALRILKEASENPDYHFEPDVRDVEGWRRIEELALRLFESADSEHLDSLEDYAFDRNAPMPVLIALKLARSKSYLTEIRKPVHISIVYAVYNEIRRMKRPEEDPAGEDFVIRKIEQMEFLTSGIDGVSWDMYIIDDGCPHGSGKEILKILRERAAGYMDRVHVGFLQNAIERSVEVVGDLSSPDESRKGGSILYGMYLASRIQRENHVIIYTDADLSTHLGQSGLLVYPIIRRGKRGAIGTRRHRKSVVIKRGKRNVRGKLFIYLWKQMLYVLDYITDTQCGFKGFDAETVRRIVPGVKEKKFAFDIEILLKVEMLERGSMEVVPIAWIDSEEASTTTSLNPYLDMLKSVARMYRDYLKPTPRADAFARLVENMTPQEWERLLDNVPRQIAEEDPEEFSGLHLPIEMFMTH